MVSYPLLSHLERLGVPLQVNYGADVYVGDDVDMHKRGRIIYTAIHGTQFASNGILLSIVLVVIVLLVACVALAFQVRNKAHLRNALERVGENIDDATNTLETAHDFESTEALIVALDTLFSAVYVDLPVSTEHLYSLSYEANSTACHYD